jgi:polyhydroxyalkanoate synthesis regulator phasin
MRMTIDELAKIMKSCFSDLESRIDEIKQGQETILLRLDHHAWKVDVDDLKHRVGKIEKKIGLGVDN